MAESITNLMSIDEQNEKLAYDKMNYAPQKREFYKSIYSDKVRYEDTEPKRKFNGHATFGKPQGAYH